MTAPGRHDAERVTLTRLPSGVAVTTTVHTYAGDDDGPTVYVQAAQHGREINGTEVCRRLHTRLRSADLSGRVVVVPVANPLTFDRISYTTPEHFDSVNPNMNRVWPGNADGSVHQRMAARLWEYAADADAVVDLHTGSPDMQTHVVYEEGNDAARRLAEAFGTDLLLAEPAGEDAPEEWADRRFDGKLRVAAADEDVPAITPELSHNKQIIEEAVEVGLRGTLNVLRELDVLPGGVVTDAEPTVARNHLGRVDATDAGLFRPDPSLSVGQHVTEGRTLGTLYDPTTYETLQTATTTNDGVLYALTKESTVTAGDRLASVAKPL